MWKRFGIALILFNTADAFFTQYWLSKGFVEANPIMAHVLHENVYWFLFDKLILVNGLGLFVGWSGINYKIARYGVVILTIIYALLDLLHIIYLWP